MLALRLPPDIEKRLDDLAKLTGRSKSFYAREAIVEHLDDIEDAYLADSRMRENPEFLTLEESMVDLGITAKDLEEGTSR